MSSDLSRKKPWKRQTPTFRIVKDKPPQPSTTQPPTEPSTQSSAQPSPGLFRHIPPPSSTQALSLTEGPPEWQGFVSPSAVNQNLPNYPPTVTAPPPEAPSGSAATPNDNGNRQTSAQESSSQPQDNESGSKRKEYVGITRDDETELFLICVKNKALYLARGKGHSIRAFYDQIVKDFRAKFGKQVNRPSVQRHVQLAANRYIEKLKEPGNEAEEVTKWSVALKEWARVEIERRGDTEALEILRDKEGNKRRRPLTEELADDWDWIQHSPDHDDSAIDASNRTSQSPSPAIRPAGKRPRLSKPAAEENAEGSFGNELGKIASRLTEALTDLTNINERSIEQKERKIKQENELRRAELSLRRQELRNQERATTELASEIRGIKRDFQERFSAIEQRVNSSIITLMDVLNKQGENRPRGT